MHELFFNLIHDKVEEEVKKENKELRKISLDPEEKSLELCKKKSTIDININDLDIHQLQNPSSQITFKLNFFFQYN